ncbi:YceI family protein [Rhodoferax sp. 4810]|uniref:YceI family protein n=2 Tax=Thiospirillum jenense TaxID=1653858 RepID=A0A839HDS5_9GAMM|nr:YceI family protein [Rhodoferax jenense]MBB1126644.1 YceI family protein [Thiospirillum jenense]
MSNLTRSFILMTATLLTTSAWADWSLDAARSQLNFISIKSQNLADVHQFAQLNGQLTTAGALTIRIPLASLTTDNAVRDQRLRDILFETAQFQDATLTAQLDTAALDALKVGEMVELTSAATLSLHGVNQAIKVTVTVAKLNATTLFVANKKPVILDAAQFNFTAALEQLRELAGLPVISRAVPVNFHLTFVQPAP